MDAGGCPSSAPSAHGPRPRPRRASSIAWMLNDDDDNDAPPRATRPSPPLPAPAPPSRPLPAMPQARSVAHQHGVDDGRGKGGIAWLLNPAGADQSDSANNNNNNNNNAPSFPPMRAAPHDHNHHGAHHGARARQGHQLPRPQEQPPPQEARPQQRAAHDPAAQPPHAFVGQGSAPAMHRVAGPGPGEHEASRGRGGGEGEIVGRIQQQATEPRNEDLPVGKRKRGRKPKNIDRRCRYCGLVYTHTGDLNKHLRTHTGEKPFPCTHPGCDKAFAVRCNLLRHITTHEASRGVKCRTPGCNAVLADRSQLREHKRIVHGVGSREDGRLGRAVRAASHLPFASGAPATSPNLAAFPLFPAPPSYSAYAPPPAFPLAGERARAPSGRAPPPLCP